MNPSIRLASILFLSAGAAAAARAQSPPSRPAANRSPATPKRAEAFADLEKRRIADGHGPETAKKFAPEYAAFAKENAGTDEGLEAKLWLLQQTWWEREAGTMPANAKKMAEEILAEYPKNPGLAKIAEYQYCFGTDDKVGILEKLLAIDVPVVRASALFSLGNTEFASRDKAVKDRGRERLETLRRDYANIPWKHTTFGEIAESCLSPHDPASLAVGKPAPEIIGRDASGKEMRLSEFRGKVVVLDFWGFW
jgi:hypothetical protein